MRLADVLRITRSFLCITRALTWAGHGVPDVCLKRKIVGECRQTQKCAPFSLRSAQLSSADEEYEEMWARRKLVYCSNTPRCDINVLYVIDIVPLDTPEGEAALSCRCVAFVI